jgi:mono/diheme cytochrome c family protein
MLTGAPWALAQTPVQPPAQQPAQSDLVKQGEYLARAGDCFSCHTAEKGALMAGGRQLATPFGTIASPNITPDRDTGIGKWSDDDFYKVLHQGLMPDGGYIYPVMPFDHYTKVTRADAMAIKAYLFSLPPIHAPLQRSHLEFPFDIRESLLAWRTLFFKEGTFKPDPTLTAQENRGAYLVEGLGHCGACHTPRNIMTGSITSEKLGGGEITGQGWFAPNISSDVREGIGGWSESQLVDYLKAGVTPTGNIVNGPMSEVVHTSMRYMTDQDLHAIAAYLKVVPKQALYQPEAGTTPPGNVAYLTNCASCHRMNGEGVPGIVPALAGNGAVLAQGPQDVIRTVLGGMNAHGSYAAMPGFATEISDKDIAEIANYVRASWGNAAPATATSAMVGNLSKTTHTMLAGTAGCDPIASKPIADALASPALAQPLHEVTGSNMVEQIDLILPKLEQAAPGVPQDDMVNGLIAAYCPIIRDNQSQSPEARVHQLQRFATVVFSRLHAGRGDAGMGGK